MLSDIKFNPKITFKFIENIWQERDHRESESNIKSVYRKQCLPHSFTELMFLKAMNAYEYICNKDQISINKINDIAKIYLPNFQVSNKNEPEMEELVKMIQEALIYDCRWLEKYLKIFRFCILFSSFKGYEIEMAKLFSNYALIVNGKPPIIMYCYSSEKIANLIRFGGDEKEIYKIITYLIKRTEKFNLVHECIDLTSIESEIMTMHDELINDYGIIHLSIFGSYARGEENEYSDLDVVCEVRKDFRNIGNLREQIASRISEAIGLSVDVMINDVTYDANQVPVDIFKEKINLF